MAKTATPTTVTTTISVTVDGISQSLKMTFGLLRELAALFGSVDNIGRMASEIDFLTDVLSIVLTPREPNGKIVAAYVEGNADPVRVFRDVDNVEISLQDIALVTEWVAGHVLAFFISQGQALIGPMQAAQKQTAALTQRVNGLQT